MYVCMYVCTLYTKAHTHAQVEVSIILLLYSIIWISVPCLSKLMEGKNNKDVLCKGNIYVCMYVEVFI